MLKSDRTLQLSGKPAATAYGIVAQNLRKFAPGETVLVGDSTLNKSRKARIVNVHVIKN